MQLGFRKIRESSVSLPAYPCSMFIVWKLPLTETKPLLFIKCCFLLGNVNIISYALIMTDIYPLPIKNSKTKENNWIFKFTQIVCCKVRSPPKVLLGFKFRFLSCID